MRQPTDLRPTVTVGTLYDLNERFLATIGAQRGLAVGGRYEIRDGEQYCLGGLRWRLVTDTAVYEAVTAEDEALPDVPLVRAGWPFAFASDASEVAA